MQNEPRERLGAGLTVLDILRQRSATQPDRLAYAFLQDGDATASLTYHALDQRARAIAAQLKAMGASGAALLVYPSGLDFVAAFFGCLYAGLVAVPVFPPRRHRPDQRIAAIIADSQAAFGLTTADILADLDQRSVWQPEIKQLAWIATDTDCLEAAAEFGPAAQVEGAPAYLQYTSGSTSTPKGVMVSHRSLIHTLADLDGGWRHDADSVMVSWLPLFHDMGLIYGMLQPLYNGFPCYLMEPAAFLQRPSRWLEAISRFGGTHSAAPNFAFDLCVRSIGPEERARLDLRRWRVVLNAAEPVREDTLRRFMAAFGASGFGPKVFCPGYGLAECSLKVTAVRRDTGFKALRIDPDALAQGRIEAAAEGVAEARTLIACGTSEVGARIAIVDPETLTECPPDRVGEIWVAGDSVAQGYWRRPQETEETFRARLADTGEGPFLRTGDMGFLRDGELYITGRLKDMVIVRGANHYPQDIELTVERCHPAVKPSGGAAFAVEVDGGERLVIAQELERTQMRGVNVDEVVEAIRSAVSREHDLSVHAIVLLRPASIPKTSSGKIQRRACRRDFLAGDLKVVAEWREPRRIEPDFGGTVAEARPATAASHAPIERWILAQLAERLGVSPAALDARESFANLGLDSMSAVRLSAALEDWLGRKLSPTIVFEYPTPDALSRFLAHGLPDENPAAARPAADLAREPIAVIGMACRFPGAPDPEAFWENLRTGRDGVSVPTTRWERQALRDPAAARRPGHFLDHIDQFDADFFGLSPREARNMDPQQRLLLEVAWEAMENASLADLSGSATGVFVGISTNDYSRLLLNGQEPPDAYCGTGGAMSIAANRLSYLLDLRGPSWAVDTACSSSLVALHNACQSLRTGECDLAFAGGVNLVASPELTSALADARMLSSDGRCKTFDATADGYGRGEGCGVVLLKRRADALRDGDNILAVVMGSAVNQDGRSNGLTAPNGLAQRDVIRRALDNAGLEPAAIGYVETHGTGTPLGDPIEVEALKAVLDVGRAADQACWLGSVKTNIGHLEAAAGIAGFIKTVLALTHGELPPHLNLHTLNPHIQLDGTPFAIPTARQAWPRADRPRAAGVSSFGFGGTNAHVILREAEPAETVAEAPAAQSIAPPPQLLALSAKHPDALRQLAGRYLAKLEAAPETPLADLCFSANTGRRHFLHRAACLAETPEQLRQQLAAVAAGSLPAGVRVGEAPPSGRAKVVFMFGGQGCQYPGMGRALYETEPRFRETLDECDRRLRPWLATPLLDVLYGGPDCGELLDQTAYAQPALFALEYALADLWRSWGVEPEAVLGHSLGEYVAACVAGVFSLADGLRLVAERGRLMQAAPGQGEMVAVFAAEARVAEIVEAGSESISIAALNGPHNTVVSGPSAAIADLVAACAEANIATRKLRTSHAFHSALMEPILAEFAQVAASVQYHPPALDLMSNLTGDLAGPDIASPDYWVRHLRQPVRFAEGVMELARRDCRLFLEIGPHPVLAAQSGECVAEIGGQSEFAWLPSLRRDQADRAQLLATLAELYARGAAVDWRGVHGDFKPRRVSLPNYPFQRQRHWVATAAAPASVAALKDEPGSTAVTRLIERGDAPALARHLAAHENLAPEHLGALEACLRALVGRHRQEAMAHALKNWFYRVDWQAQTRRGAAQSVSLAAGRWLILGNPGGLGERLCGLLEKQGTQARYIAAGGSGAIPTEALDWLCQDAAEVAVRGLVQLGALDPPAPDAPLTERFAPGCAATLRLLQDLAGREGAAAPKLWLVTQGAVPATGPKDCMDSMGQAAAWGLGRVIRLEHPDLWGGLVDLAPGESLYEQAEALAAELLDGADEDQIALRSGRRLAPRLRAAHLPGLDAGGGAQAFRPRADGTYLITGGLGGLGLKLAEWLAERGARHLVLAGRNAPSADAARRLAELEQAAGASVVSARADIAVESDVARLLDHIHAQLPPLVGIFHAAAVIDDGILIKQDSQRFATVLAPKAAGAWHLHRLTQHLPLDCFVLFSSATALFGWRGQGTYAAANACLDALAHHRRSLGLPALSLNWGPWAEVGAAARRDERHGTRWENQGLHSLDPGLALHALELALAGTDPQLAVLSMDAAVLAQTLAPVAPLALLAELVPEPPLALVKEAPAPVSYALRHRLREAAASERRGILCGHIQAEVAKILGFPAGQVPEARQGFFDMGLDSLMALELRNRLDAAVGRRLPPTLAFEYPSIDALAGHLVELLAPAPVPVAAPRVEASANDAAALAEIQGLSDSELESLVDMELQRSLR